MRLCRASLRAAWLIAAAVLGGAFATSPAEARDCRRENVPPGVRMPQQVGCKPLPPSSGEERTRPSVKTGRQPGFVDLGNGTELRIGGDADVEMRYRR